MKTISNKLLSIPADSFRMYFVVYTPLAILWHIAVVHVIYENPIDRKIVSWVVAIVSIFRYYFAISVLYFMCTYEPDIDGWIGCWIFLAIVDSLISIVLAVRSINFEKEHFKEYPPHTTGAARYWIRIYCMVHWLTGVWAIQRMVNCYVSEQEH